MACAEVARLHGMLATPLLCLIVGVFDGHTLSARCALPDALQLHQSVQVRLQGVNAPQAQQPYGPEAREALRAMTLGQTAQLRCSKVDHQQHRVCTVWVAPASAPDGPRTLDAGLAMLTVGLARCSHADAQKQSPQERGQYAFAEQEAKARKAGLWRTNGVVDPPDC